MGSTVSWETFLISFHYMSNLFLDFTLSLKMKMALPVIQSQLMILDSVTVLVPPAGTEPCLLVSQKPWVSLALALELHRSNYIHGTNNPQL